MILECIYDSPNAPYFRETSHGFRSNHSCHTALKDIREKWSAVNWYIEGDIRACFDEIDHGSSYVQAVTWGKGRCPLAATILTYSQSDNPESPFYADQTRLFSKKEWVPDHFCRADVVAHTKSTTELAH